MRFKQAFLLVAMILGLSTLSSCSSSPTTPEEAVSKYLDGVIQENFKKMASCSCFKDGTPLSPEEQDKLAKIFAKKLENHSGKEIMREKIEIYKIIDTEYNAEKTKAKVEVTIIFADGHSDKERIKLLKGSDDKWYIRGPSRSEFVEIYNEYFN